MLTCLKRTQLFYFEFLTIFGLLIMLSIGMAIKFVKIIHGSIGVPFNVLHTLRNTWRHSNNIILLCIKVYYPIIANGISSLN